MLAALLVAEGIGLALLISRPPLYNAPVSLTEVARYLDLQADSRGLAQHAPPEPHMPFDTNRPPPPPDFDGPPRSLPGHRAPPPKELMVRTSATAPAQPRDLDRAASQRLRTQLAALLATDRESVLVYVDKDDMQPWQANARIGEIMLREGFIVARHLPNGDWRIVESVIQGFPNAFQKQAMMLFAFGLAALLPLAWLFAKALSAPIRRFSAAARRVGTDPNAPPLPVEGPAEMLLAVESFNAMQARLHRLLQERTQMIAAIAHDLRTPLTRLAFRLENLPSPLTEKVNADIQEMKSMISAALDFIRDRALSERRERLDFRLLVETVVDDHNDLGRDVSLESGAPVTVEGDPLALRRAVANLVDNAIKYGERARLRLLLADDRCTLEVDDDGPGIADSLKSRVFEPFFRVESSRNRDTGGIGLGLAVVRATVVDHGGEVSLHNLKDGGLRVTLWLPLADG